MIVLAKKALAFKIDCKPVVVERTTDEGTAATLHNNAAAKGDMFPSGEKRLRRVPSPIKRPNQGNCAMATSSLEKWNAPTEAIDFKTGVGETGACFPIMGSRLGFGRTA